MRDKDVSQGVHVEMGIYTFAETTPDPETGRTISSAQRLRDLMEEIELADQVGLDVFGVGEHHRPDFAVSSPAVVLAAAAERTKRIRLTSAVTVLSSDDPVRVFQDFAEVDLLSGGRAEIMAGRGSFIESFPLFGYDLEDYDELYAEKLDLLLKIRDEWAVMPHIYFAWAEGNPFYFLLRYLISGEGDVPPVTREVLRRAEPKRSNRPWVHVG